MSFGLRTYDEYGNITLDLVDRITRYHGTYHGVAAYVGGYNQVNYLGNFRGTVTIPGLVSDGSWFIGIPSTSVPYTYYISLVSPNTLTLEFAVMDKSSGSLTFSIDIMRC